MPQRLGDVVLFRGDRLFNGAVNISWYGTDEEKSRMASAAFVFHGPTYHGVQQDDIGTEHGHRLIDTASLALSVVRRCYGVEEIPFTLAIAGYGTGKSHLGLTLASLVHSPDGDTAQGILSAIETADAGIGGDIRLILQESNQPCLAVALNGMQSFDLAAEITKQIVRTLKADGHDPKLLDDLRPRFGQAASLIRMSNESVVKELIDACDVGGTQELLTALEQQDERAYAKVHDFFAVRGMPIRAITGESVRDVVDIAVREYCGKGKPYRSLLILFDEFGKYTEFATVRSQIAGSGALQDLFEAVQANAQSACFVGFIQFELNAYVQRVAQEYKNEILRYVTRYQAASRVYLSINLETLIASLLEKRQHKILDKWFDGKSAKEDSQAAMSNLGKWFPQSKNHRLWGDADQFHSIIRKGCWPLSPYSTWFLFYLASAGKHLQERSALALLGDVFQRYEGAELPASGDWSLSPADLWSDALQQELISSEEAGQQGAITHAYASVLARHGSRLTPELKGLLCAIVLASKLGLQVSDKDDAIEALGEIAGVPLNVADRGIRLLQEEYNVIEWDQAFKAFDILGDAIPRNQFLAFVKQRVASSYDEAGKAKLFASKAATWCDLLVDLDCDFAEECKITTREWRYQAVTSSLDYLPQHITMAADRWKAAVGVDDARGTIIYTYVEQNRDPAGMLADTKRFLRSAAKDAGVSALPILVVLLCDETGALGQALAEYAVLEESMSEEDRVRFGNLIGAHKEKLHRVIREQVEAMVRRRRYATGLKEELESHRLGPAGRELFAKIYKTPIPFPFDGFSTAKGNAADTCQELTMELLLGRLDYNGIIAKPVKSKNRAVTVLKEAWGIFNKNGDVSRRPTCPIIRTITEKWDDALTGEEKRISIEDALRILCRPPYGANIASAGLMLSVFVAPRSDKLVVVRDGQQLALSQWVQEGIFRGKFIDLSALHQVDFTFLGEASEEWEALLDEWEQADNHLARKSCLERSLELKSRVPVPPALAYREVHLKEQSASAIEALGRLEREQNEAISKTEQGAERRDVGLLTWGAAALKDIYDKMSAERPAWSDSQIAEIQPHYERARQAVIQIFLDWLGRQAPRDGTPDAAGDFKHKMIRLIGGNLKKLGLEDQYDQLEKRTSDVIKNVETAAESRQIAREVQLWLTSHGDATRFVRVAELRALHQVGKDYASKLQGLSTRIQMPEIGEVRGRLSETLTKMKEIESGILKRASKLWESKLRSAEELENLLTEVDALTSAFEGCQSDLDDLQSMRRALRLYQNGLKHLEIENLSWAEFDGVTVKWKAECSTALDGAELPWDSIESIECLAGELSKRRKEKSAEWIDSFEQESGEVAQMDASGAARLYAKANTSPAYLTEAHAKRLGAVTRKIKVHLDNMKIDWLVEEYKALPEASRKKFLQIVAKQKAD